MESNGKIEPEVNRSTGPSRPTEPTAWQEYAMIQEKLDKIGDFKFRLKSWIVTLVVAMLISGFASNLPGLALLLCAIPVFALQLLEEFQHVVQRALTRRAARLEREMRRGDKYGVPGLSFAIMEGVVHLNNSGKWIDWLIYRSQHCFYCIVYGLVVSVALLKIFTTASSDATTIEIPDPVRISIERSHETDDPLGQPSAEEPPTAETPFNNRASSKSEKQQPPGDKPPGDKPPGDKPPGDEPPGDEPPGDEPPGDEPPGDEPPRDKPLKNDPLRDKESVQLES